ncbi:MULTISPECIES: hypothetical protein [unclassified Rhizobium]|uniref:hypothetical protein n=1 Tax=unclassified Rhizobium TaxID=2613769 RepID=UPI003D2DB77F
MESSGKYQSLPFWLIGLLLFSAVLSAAVYGWIRNGSAIFLAMSESLASWCM